MLAERGYNVSRQSWCGSAGLASVSAINGYDPRRTLPADTAFGANTLGGGLGQLPGASTNAITLIPDATAVTNAVDVLVYQRPTSGTASISDGTTSVAQSFAQPSDAVARISFTGFARGAGKTYSLTRSAGGSIAPICTIAYDSTVSQIEVMNAGISGATTGTWVAAANAASPLLALQAYAPDLTIIQLGTNDMAPAVNISASAYAANLSAIITAAKQSGDCILEIPTEPSAASAGYPNYGAYAAVARDAGTSAGCVVVDHGTRLGNWASSSAGGFMFDGVHETANGYADEARAIADAAIM